MTQRMCQLFIGLIKQLITLGYVMQTFCVDKMINGHLILLQLVPVQPCWRSFGSAAGLDEEILDNVSIKYTHNRIMPTLKL